MFTKFELDTITIMILTTNNTKWFTKQCLFDEVSKYYQNNVNELYYGHFLFVWTKLLINSNFISVHPSNEKIKSKTNDLEPFDDFNENAIQVIDDMNLQVQLKHMNDFPKLYIGSVLIKDFLLQNYDCDLFFKFFKLYNNVILLKEKDKEEYVLPSTNLSLINKVKIPVTVTTISLIMIGYYYWNKK